MGKVVALSEAVKLAEAARRAGKKIVTTNGAFDMLHLGHVRYLRKAKGLGDLLFVGINSDASVRRYKGKNRPVTPEKERAEIVAALESVDYAFIFNEREPSAWIGRVKPAVHVKSGDYRLSNKLYDKSGGYRKDVIIEQSAVERNGGRVVLLPLEKTKSTTERIESILEKFSSR